MATRFLRHIHLVILIPFGLASGLLLLEVVLRFSGSAPQVAFLSEGGYRLSKNPLMGYEPVPYSLHNAEPTNSLGIRDKNHEIERPAGIKRVIVLGDSISMGIGVTHQRDIYPMLLQQLLEKERSNVEIINLSAAGYNTMQEVEFLRESGLRYQPDLVLLQYCLNDTFRHDGNLFQTLIEKEKHGAGLTEQRINKWLGWSHLYRTLRFQVFKGTDDTTSLDKSFLDIGRNTVPESLVRLRELSKEHSFKVSVVIFPDLSQLTNYWRHDAHHWITKLALENGFAVIDLLSSLAECQALASRSISVDFLHPNEIGHRCVAEELAKIILKKDAHSPTLGLPR